MMGRLVFVGLALLSGCALLAPAPVPVTTPAQPESAPFAMNGRISIDHLGERHSAGLHWTHNQQSDEILLLNPLGQTVVRVYRDDKQATLDEDGKHYQDVDAAALMQQVLGWQLPLEGLHLWVLGRPADGSPAQLERDDTGRIILLHQDGWEVHFLRYAGSAPDSLPTRLELDRAGLKVQMLVDEWQWNPQ